jgi:hypothetical protein
MQTKKRWSMKYKVNFTVEVDPKDFDDDAQLENYISGQLLIGPAKIGVGLVTAKEVFEQDDTFCVHCGKRVASSHYFDTELRECTDWK